MELERKNTGFQWVRFLIKQNKIFLYKNSINTQTFKYNENQTFIELILIHIWIIYIDNKAAKSHTSFTPKNNMDNTSQ